MIIICHYFPCSTIDYGFISNNFALKFYWHKYKNIFSQTIRIFFCISKTFIFLSFVHDKNNEIICILKRLKELLQEQIGWTWILSARYARMS